MKKKKNYSRLLELKSFFKRQKLLGIIGTGSMTASKVKQ